MADGGGRRVGGSGSGVEGSRVGVSAAPCNRSAASRSACGTTADDGARRSLEFVFFRSPVEVLAATPPATAARGLHAGGAREAHLHRVNHSGDAQQQQQQQQQQHEAEVGDGQEGVETPSMQPCVGGIRLERTVLQAAATPGGAAGGGTGQGDAMTYPLWALQVV